MKEDSFSRDDDPWSSREVGPINGYPLLFKKMVVWIDTPSLRSCGKICRYAADFEITDAFIASFPEVYEGEIRRQVRILRKNDKNVVTVPKGEHKHHNPDTNRWVQCHKLRRRVVRRVIPRTPDGD